MKENKGLENLKVWQLARDLKREIYNISDMFPKKEDYCLTSQIRSAAVSITANISEGYGKVSSPGEFAVLPYLKRVNFRNDRSPIYSA